MGGTVLGVLFIAAGVLHFLLPRTYLSIMPPPLPFPLILVYVSGAVEIAVGTGMLVPRTRLVAAWGLVLLLIAVWPANVYMAMIPERFPSIPAWALWARLPLQLPLIWWVWRYTRGDRPLR